MKDLATLLARSEAYEQRHAQWIAAGHALQAERESVIALGKTVGYFASRMQAELPKVPNLRGLGAEEVPEIPAADLLTASPPCIDFSPRTAAPTATAIPDVAARVAEVNHLFEDMPPLPGVQPDEKLCQDMTDDEILLGYADILRRRDAQAPKACDEWLETRRFAFEMQIEVRGLTQILPAAAASQLAAE